MNCRHIVFLTVRYTIIHLLYSYRRRCFNSACDLIDRLPNSQLFGSSQGEFMSLIRRTLLVVLLVALLAVPILLYALNSTLNSGLAHIERDEANQYLDRAEDALTNRIQDLIAVSRSLSRSDAAYLYAASPNPFFDEETFATSNLLEQGINLIAVVNNAGDLLNVRLINLSSYQDLPLSTNLTQALGSPQLYQHLIRGGSEIAVDAVSSGLISVDGRLMMVASTPIVTSQNTGPIRGAVITGRYLDAAENAALIASLGYSLHIRGTADPIFTTALQTETFNTLSSDQLLLIANNDEWNWAFRPLLDVFGQPVGALHLETSRQIDAVGISLANSLGIALLLTTVGSFAAIAFFMRAAIINPITHLSREIQRIRERGSLTERLALRGQDTQQNEVGKLGLTINTMLESLEKAQQRATAGESRYQMLFDKSPVAYMLWGKDLKVQAWNDYAERTFGWSASEVLGKSFFDFLLPPAARPEASTEEIIKQLAGNGLPVQTTSENLTKTRGVISCEWHNQIIRDEQGEFVAVLSMAQEVTEKLVAERKLRESEQMLKSVLDTIPVRVFWKDRSSTYLGSNHLFAADAGLQSPSELIGKTDHKLFPEQAELYRADDAKVMDAGESRLNFEEPQTTASGAPLWLRTSKVPLRNDAGEVIGILGTYEDVTEQKLAEEKLRDSSSRLEAALQGASLGLWDWNMVTNVVDYSDRWMQMLGYTPGELPGVFGTFASLVHPDDLGVVTEKVNAYVTGASPTFMMEIRLKEKTGSYRWVLTSGKIAERDSAGKPTRMVGVHLDMHQQKQTETALREVEQRYRAIADFAPIAITAINKDGVVIYSEGSVFAAAGVQSADLVGKPISQIYADNTDALASVELAMQGGLGSYSGKLGDVEYEAYAIPMADAENKPDGAITLVVDVSEVKQAEKVIRESEARLRAIMNSAPLILFGMDQEGVINLSEGHALETVGLKSGDLIGVNIRDMYELMPDIQNKIDRALKGEPMTIETPMGDTILENRYAPVIDHDGTISGIINVGLDVTERKRIERERERVVRELEDALLFKDQFLATMSHELRTPLNAVLGYSGIATMQYELPPQVVHMMERIKMNSKRLLNLINDILDISRINANRVEIVQRPINTQALAQGWHEDFGEQMRSKGLEYILDIDPTLPETIIGDEERLSQIAHNLVNNALKFTEKGSISLSVRMQDEATWSIAVTDTGIGIPDTWHHLIFDEFRQVDGTSKRKYGGAGLGLSIVQKLCRLMGGNIRVASKVGEGSTFTVTLPLRLPEAEVASA